MNSVTLTTLRTMKRNGEKFACLTAYDASFARRMEAAGVEVLLVGDSLGMVVQGQETTLPVSVSDMIYHTRNVRRGSSRGFVITDMPFMSYSTPAEALINAGRLMKQGGAQMVKIEGGEVVLDVVRHLARHGIPVCGHLGLLPQSVHKTGGYRVQGREASAAQAIMRDAHALEAAGADMVVLECIPASLAQEITASLQIPVIGIGAGAECDGQVLVVYDMLGITPPPTPRFSKNFLEGAAGIQQAFEAYVNAVKDGSFPATEHAFQ